MSDPPLDAQYGERLCARARGKSLVVGETGSDREAVDILYVTAQESATRDALGQAAQERDLDVVIFRSPADVVDGRAYAYGGPRFMERLTEHVDLASLEPVDDWLPSLPWSLTRREIQLVPLYEAQSMVGRWFVKAPREKDFEAGVHATVGRTS